MGPSAWAARYAQLADIRSRPPKRAYVAQTHPDSGLRDWLTHQKALKRLGAALCPVQHLGMVASACWPQCSRNWTHQTGCQVHFLEPAGANCGRQALS